jgi:hypothetical protein
VAAAAFCPGDADCARACCTDGGCIGAAGRATETAPLVALAEKADRELGEIMRRIMAATGKHFLNKKTDN